MLDLYLETNLLWRVFQTFKSSSSKLTLHPPHPERQS